MRQVFFVLSMAAFAATAVAQGQAPTTEAPTLGVIDMERITQDSALGTDFAGQIDVINTKIRKEVEKRQTELEKLDSNLKAAQEDLQKQAAVLSQDALEAKQLELQKQSRERDNYYQDSQAELQRQQNSAQREVQRLNQEFSEKIRPFIEDVVKSRKIDILFHVGAVAFTKENFDISGDVIAKADAAHTATPAATPAPAAPPAGTKK
jgi:Skp family chaperone for outer membrane proteins